MSKRLTYIDKLNDITRTTGEAFGNILVDVFHLTALFAIGGTIVWAAVFEFIAMVDNGGATIQDILLLFIYLELGAMVGIYFKTTHMPMRFLIYVAMTALTRLLFGFISVEHYTDFRILIIAGAILLLSIALLAIRYGSHRFTSDDASK